MEKWNRIVSLNFSGFPNLIVHQVVLQAQRPGEVHKPSLPYISVSQSSNNSKISINYSKVIFNNPIFPSNPLSELTPLKPVDTVSIFTGTSGNLAGDQHEVSR
jgi:hypothetical protein